MIWRAAGGGVLGLLAPQLVRRHTPHIESTSQKSFFMMPPHVHGLRALYGKIGYLHEALVFPTEL
jgi:hypothetical protein